MIAENIVEALCCRILCFFGQFQVAQKIMIANRGLAFYFKEFIYIDSFFIHLGRDNLWCQTKKYGTNEQSFDKLIDSFHSSLVCEPSLFRAIFEEKYCK